MRKNETSSRRTRILVVVIVVLFMFLGLSIAANFAVVYAVVDG